MSLATAESIIADYYADTTHVSRSMLEDFIVSPALYHGRYVAKTIPVREESPAMRLGTAVHALIFGGERVAAAPKVDRRTNVGKAAWASFCAENADAIVLDQDVYDRAWAMRESIRNHPIASDIIANATDCERIFTRVHEPTGLKIKSKLDCLSCFDGRDCIADLKTTEKPYPDQFGRNLPNYGYHRQAAFYRQFPEEARIWVWIAVGSEPPHETFVYEPDQMTLDIAQGENDAALARLAHCTRTGNWSHPQSALVNGVSLPKWFVERKIEYVPCDW